MVKLGLGQAPRAHCSPPSVKWFAVQQAEASGVSLSNQAVDHEAALGAGELLGLVNSARL